MNVGPDDELIRAAAALMRANRRDYEALMRGLSIHTEHVKAELVRCAPEVVHTAQGRAKHAVELLTLMGNAGELAVKLDQRINK